MCPDRYSFQYLTIMRRSIDLLILVWMMSGLVFVSFGQSRKDLEKQRMQIIKDIEKTSKELEKTKKTKEKNISQLKALEDQLATRKKLLENLKAEVTLNENLITDNEKRIGELQTKQQEISRQYKSVIRSAFLRNMSNSKWSYLLSSQNLNNFVIRWRYIHQFENYADHKLTELKRITGEIHDKNEDIRMARQQNLETLDATSKNMTLLQKEQKEKDALVKKLEKEEGKLRTSLKKRESEREKLNAAIEKIIIAELSKKSEKSETTAAASKRAADNTGFANNRGALNWPVNSGKITGRFGTHPHPSLKNVQVSNNGVDFTLPGPENVHCVYEGEVVGVTFIPGFENMIIIRHGNYYTVYSRIKEVTVSKGQKVKRGQTLGRVGPDAEGNTEFHFELWKEKSKLDPESWFNR